MCSGANRTIPAATSVLVIATGNARTHGIIHAIVAGIGIKRVPTIGARADVSQWDRCGSALKKYILD